MKKTLIGGLLVSVSLLLGSAALAQGVNGSATPSAPAPLQPTHGSIWYTAAINADGTVASCLFCNRTSTTHLGTGTYQVAFTGNVTAVNGFSRLLQVDTLTTGSETAFCTTADRAGLATAVFVSCANAAGPVDASFFLFVAR